MMRTNTPSSTRWVAPLLAGILVLLLDVRFHMQGFNLLDDGLWVLGTRVLATGGVLYRDLFTIYGPARYLFVMPFFLIAGKSVWALALAKAASDGLAAGIGLWGVRRLGAGRWAWFVPVGVIALGPVQPRYLAAALLAFTAARYLTEGLDRRRGLMLGIGWGLLSLFGLDMAGYGAVMLGAGWVASRIFQRGQERPKAASWLAVVGGMSGVLAVGFAVALAFGALNDLTWDTLVYPVTRFGGSMGLAWWHDFQDAGKLTEAFASLFTGETLAAAWPGHLIMRLVALRGMYLFVWFIPLAGMVGVIRSRQVAWAPVVGLALAGWATLLGRGDPDHLVVVWFGCLLLAVLLVAAAARWRRWSGWLVGAVLVALLSPLLLEHLWLATHLGRPTLARWERPTARIYLDAERIKNLEELLNLAPTDPRMPLLTWPIQPGLTFLQGSALATAQTTLLAGEVRDPARVVADLERTRPQAIIQGRASGIVPGVRTFRALAPDIYPYVRTHYTIVGSFEFAREKYQLLARRSASNPPVVDLPLKRQLPAAEQHVQGSYTPLITGRTRIIQTLPVREFPFHGLVLKLAAQGPYPVTIPVILTILEMLPSGKAVVRWENVTPVTFNQLVENVEFTFDPVTGSVGKKMGFMLANDDPAGPPFRAVWDLAPDGKAEGPDFFPEGEALVDGSPAPADLYFLAY